MNKTALIDTLNRWIHQRPGLEPRNYISGWNDTDGRRAYRAEVRSITKDLHQARALLQFVAGRDSITAEQILDACRHSFSGRLSIKLTRSHKCGCGHKWSAPVELSEATPNLSGEKTQWCSKCGSRPQESSPQFYEIEYCTGQYWPTEYRRAVCSVLSSAIWEWLRANMPKADGHKLIDINGKMLEIETHRGMTPGDYLRKAAQRELGRPIASRWFN